METTRWIHISQIMTIPCTEAAHDGKRFGHDSSLHKKAEWMQIAEDDKGKIIGITNALCHACKKALEAE